MCLVAAGLLSGAVKTANMLLEPNWQRCTKQGDVAGNK